MQRRSADWTRAAELLEASKPDPALVNLAALRESLLDYTRGMAAIVAGDVAAADARSKGLGARLAKKPPEEPMGAMPGMGAGSKDALARPLHSFLDVAALELRASVLMAQGKAAEADQAFGKAADAERTMGYREPPHSIRPVKETRGDALMRARRYGNAKSAYEAALKERPNSGFPLFGIAQAEVALGDRAAAATDFRALMEVWKYADAGLPQVVAAKPWLAGQTAGPGE